MTIEESKNLLKTKGYTSFNLKDFNQEYYDYFLPFKCNEESNLKEHIKGLRADYVGMNLQKDSYKTFSEAEIEKEELLQIVKGKKEGENNFSQIYYQFHFRAVFEKLMGFDGGSTPPYAKIISNGFLYSQKIEPNGHGFIKHYYLDDGDKRLMSQTIDYRTYNFKEACQMLEVNGFEYQDQPSPNRQFLVFQKK